MGIWIPTQSPTKPLETALVSSQLDTLARLKWWSCLGNVILAQLGSLDVSSVNQEWLSGVYGDQKGWKHAVLGSGTLPKNMCLLPARLQIGSGLLLASFSQTPWILHVSSLQQELSHRLGRSSPAEGGVEGGTLLDMQLEWRGMSTSGGIMSPNVPLLLPAPQQSSVPPHHVAPLHWHWYLFLGMWGNLRDKAEHLHDQRITEWLGLKGPFKDHFFQPSCHKLGHFSLDQVVQSYVQPDLEHFQW